MIEDDAVSLFLERAHAVRPDIEDIRPVHELVRRLDRLPLALELAAARTKLLSPGQLLERLGQRLDLLKGGRDADERHATLRATIEWSHDLLDRAEQQLFARLAVFSGGCTLEAAEQVCDAELDSSRPSSTRASSVGAPIPSGTDRYWMLETIREFAAERLTETREEDRLRGRQIDVLVDVADRAGLGGVAAGGTRWQLHLIAPELDNIRAALAWAEDRDPVQGLRLANRPRGVLGRP